MRDAAEWHQFLGPGLPCPGVPISVDPNQGSREAAVVVDRPYGDVGPVGSRIDRQKEARTMLRPALIGLIALGVMAGAVAAQGNMDCGKAYKGFWEKLDREKYAKISPDQTVLTHHAPCLAHKEKPRRSGADF
jgi:hypothetical protein